MPNGVAITHFWACPSPDSNRDRANPCLPLRKARASVKLASVASIPHAKKELSFYFKTSYCDLNGYDE